MTTNSLRQIKKNFNLIISITIFASIAICAILVLLKVTISDRTEYDPEKLDWVEYQDNLIKFKYPQNSTIKNIEEFMDERCGINTTCDINEYLGIEYGNLNIIFYHGVWMLGPVNPITSGYKIIAGNIKNGIGRTYLYLDNEKVKVYYFKLDGDITRATFIDRGFLAGFTTQKGKQIKYEPLVDVIVASTLNMTVNKEASDPFVIADYETCDIIFPKDNRLINIPSCNERHSSFFHAIINNNLDYLLIESSSDNKLMVQIYDIEKDELISIEDELSEFLIPGYNNLQTNWHSNAKWENNNKVVGDFGFNYGSDSKHFAIGRYTFNTTTNKLSISQFEKETLY